MERACKDLNALTLVYQNEQGSIYQSDKLNCYFLDFGGKFARFNFSALHKLKARISKVDLEAMLLDMRNPNFELITFHGCEHIYLLNVTEIVALKDLLQGAFAMFKLNTLINDCLYRLVI